MEYECENQANPTLKSLHKAAPTLKVGLLHVLLDESEVSRKRSGNLRHLLMGKWNRAWEIISAPRTLYFAHRGIPKRLVDGAHDLVDDIAKRTVLLDGAERLQKWPEFLLMHGICAN